MAAGARELLSRYDVPIAIIGSQDFGYAPTWIVHSSAIDEAHPSLGAAQELDARVMRRGECLAEVAREKRVIGVAGSHGKTSTTGILIDLLEEIGANPSYAIGGLFADGKSPGRWTDSEWLVLELDESDGTIEKFRPEVSVILNADHDHHAYYSSFEEYLDVFRRLANRTSGVVVLAESLRPEFASEEFNADVVYPDVGDGSIRESNQLGAFSESNQRLAIAAARAAGFDTRETGQFVATPIARRQNCLYFSPRLKIFEDYAHHPVEIEAMREALSSGVGGPTIAVFQPHRYSRTRSLKDALAAALESFDFIYLLDVYAASEAPLPGGGSEDLLEACRARFDRCAYLPSEDGLLESLRERVEGMETATVLFLGAGRTDALGERFANETASADARWGGVFRGLAIGVDARSRIRANVSLGNKTTLRVGGDAEVYYEPASIDELTSALRLCKEASIPVYPLGRGSNLIVPDEGVAGLVVRLSHASWKRFDRLSEDSVQVGAGLRIKELCGTACREGLEGFEFLEGIPGSVGGALRMNAGAMGGWMFDIVKSVRYVTLDGDLVEASASELSVGYRHCRELESAIAIDAVLTPKAVGRDEAELRRAIDVYQSKRKESQPREPSAGCIFKNPEGDSAGRLIEELGLKGTVIGGAEISCTHGNFIVNRGGATSADVIELIRLARRVAKGKRSVTLEPEALLYGSEWKDALS